MCFAKKKRLDTVPYFNGVLFWYPYTLSKFWWYNKVWLGELVPSQEANLVEEVEDSQDFWSGPVQSYSTPVEYRFLIGLDRSTNGPLPDCDRK